METKFQTSFIPKKNSAGEEAYSYKRPFGSFLIIAICIVALSILLAAGTFVYKAILQRSANSKVAELQDIEQQFNTTQIDAVVRFADKLDSANKLLDTHVAVTPIFTLLQENTLQNLQFTELNYTYLATNKIAVSMKGIAKDFGVIAKQSDAFSEVTGSSFASPLFTDLNFDETGNATFSFLTTVDPNLVLYKNTLNTTTNP